MSENTDKSLKEGTAEGGQEAGQAAKDSKQEDSSDSTQKPSSRDADRDFLSEYLARSLGLREKPEQKLEELTLEGVAKYINSDKCKNIVTMAGAGISTSAGIPDFRSPDTGLYNNLASYNLPYPQAIFELEFFMENPKPFFVLSKELMPGAFKPTPCHYFLKILNNRGKLLRHYTQNIDTLERVAGLDPDKIVEAHGTFHTSHCLKCRKEFQFPWVKEQVMADQVPKCDADGCDGVVKPDIVFFGERLPDRFVELVSKDLPKCDLLIIMGTSLTVQPFASLVSRVPFDTPRLYINLEKGSTTNNPISALMFGGGFSFDSEDNYRDVFKGATCDDGCQELADLLGEGDILRDLVKKEHDRIDMESSNSDPKSTSQGTSESSPLSAGDRAASSKQTTPKSQSKSGTAESKVTPKTPSNHKL